MDSVDFSDVKNPWACSALLNWADFLHARTGKHAHGHTYSVFSSMNSVVEID